MAGATRLRPEAAGVRSRGRTPRAASAPAAWVFYVLLAVLVACPLPFGSWFQWSWAALAVIVGGLLLASAAQMAVRGIPLPGEAAWLWLPALLYLAVAAWVAIQASGLTPAAWHHPLWREGAEAVGRAASGAVSLDPYRARSELVQMLSYAGIFWLALVHGRPRERARAALWALAVAGALYALYGLVAYLTELGGTFLFHEMQRGRPGVTGTFVNRNMYVVYAGFGVLVVFSLLLDRWLALLEAPPDRRASWRAFVHGRRSRILLPVILAIVLLAALTMTGSRGGVLATALALGALGVCALGYRAAEDPARRRHVLRFAVGLLAFWAVIYALAGAHLGERLAEAEGGGGRLAGYRLALQAIAERPLTGFGAGSFKEVFYLHNDGTFWTTFNYSHNLYLGSAVELGVPAAALLIGAVALVAVACLKGVRRRRRDRIFPMLGVGATVLVAVHGLVDSPLYLPANAATYALLLGLAAAQSWPSRPNPPAAAAPGAAVRRPRGSCVPRSP